MTGVVECFSNFSVSHNVDFACALRSPPSTHTHMWAPFLETLLEGLGVFCSVLCCGKNVFVHPPSDVTAPSGGLSPQLEQQKCEGWGRTASEKRQILVNEIWLSF